MSVAVGDVLAPVDGRSLSRTWRGARLGLLTVPRAGWACALVMLANGLAWSLITPPFEVPDENAHYAYVQQVAERGTVPRTIFPENKFSPAQVSVLGNINFFLIVGRPENPAPMSDLQQQRLQAVEREHLSTLSDGDALSATNNPPLYYALEAVPYKLAPGGVLGRLEAMRVLSALMGAMSVLLIYLFLAELLPGRPWAWAAGALVAAFEPLFGFMSGGLNNDNLLYLTSAGLLWSLARMFRRGLTPRNGALIGAFTGLGIVTKLTMLGLLPAALLGVLYALWRGWKSDRAQSLGGAAWAGGLGGAPVVAYLLLNHLVWHRGAIPGGIGSVEASAVSPRTFTFREELSHIWQLFLPPLWLHHQFTYLPLWKTWFEGFFGRLGWLDYKFPYHFYVGLLVVVIIVLVLAVAELVRCRRAFVRRAGEFLVYGVALAGLCVEIGVQSYREFIQSGGQFEQARYMLPVLGLYAAIVALAVRVGGRRWGPVVGAALVCLAIGHDIFAQVMTIGRYYT